MGVYLAVEVSKYVILDQKIETGEAIEHSIDEDSVSIMLGQHGSGGEDEQSCNMLDRPCGTSRSGPCQLSPTRSKSCSAILCRSPDLTQLWAREGWPC